jgi:hypothetical protein
MNRRRTQKTVRPVQVNRVKQEIVLVATSESEYRKLVRDYPQRTIVYDVPYEQAALFNTREYLDV